MGEDREGKDNCREGMEYGEFYRHKKQLNYARCHSSSGRPGHKEQERR